ncbi:MAG: hypothetical protein OWQ52_00615 [Metallosphaera prunae]|uniref:hypothetical protein n=1 Tax=Metallosphaera prunae TaxID=47304 RepID=UPI0022725B38|nr:hypothetical protein [Metallosphaera prunae]MCY0860917.1 hypothetical protein [Metallosphaera prunae]
MIHDIQGDIINILLKPFLDILISLVLEYIKNHQEKSKEQDTLTWEKVIEDSITLTERWSNETEIESGETKIKTKTEWEFTIERSHKSRPDADK